MWRAGKLEGNRELDGCEREELGKCGHQEGRETPHPPSWQTAPPIGHCKNLDREWLPASSRLAGAIKSPEGISALGH